MKFKHPTKTSTSDRSQTPQKQRKHLPRPCIQDTIKQTYNNLLSIPTIQFGCNIKHLYLSHNRLASLKGIQNFTSLVSFNVAYNNLKEIGEVRYVVYPQNIDKVGLRGNLFQFGYQDYAVGVFYNMRRLEAQVLQGVELRKQVWRKRGVVADYIGEFYRMTQVILEEMKKSIERESGVRQNKKEQKNLLKSQLFYKLKQTYFSPSQQKLRQKTMTSLLNTCYQYIQIITNTQIYTQKQVLPQLNHAKQVSQSYEHICRQIMLLFNHRNDGSLQRQLRKYNMGSLSQSFAILGVVDEVGLQCQRSAVVASGGYRIPLIEECPSNYMNKIDQKGLKNHPMSMLANWQQPQNPSLFTQQGTRWQQFYKKQQVQIQPHCFQRFPVFIYCKQYLQAITQLILDRVGMILNLENEYMRGYWQQSSGQMEVNLSLSNSQTISFGQKEEITKNQIVQPKDIIKVEQNDYGKENTNPNTKEMLNTKTTLTNIAKTSTLIKQDYTMNISKYSIYQINLAFKVFRSLKHRISLYKSIKHKTPSNL